MGVGGFLTSFQRMIQVFRNTKVSRKTNVSLDEDDFTIIKTKINLT